MTTLSPSTLKDQWNIWLQVAVWTGTAIGMFLLQPPVLTLSSSAGLDPLRFAHFIFAVLAALAFQLFKKTVRSRATRLWLAGGSALAAILLFFGYMTTLNSWTCPYAVHWQVVRSESYTDDARKTAATLPGQGRNCAEVLKEYAGAAELVWDSSETKARYVALQALYLLLWVCSAFALILAMPPAPNATPAAKRPRKTASHTSVP